jgi:formate hydrogenlyase subunit 3/multisubunit Na+/H+ antiporter MnhD subunit
MNYQNFQNLSAKWDMLKNARPSTFRNHFIFWILRLVFNVIIIGCVIIFSTTFFKEMWLPLFEEDITREDAQIINDFFIGVRVILGFIMIISGIIVWLSARAIHRNNYIDVLENIIEDYRETANSLANIPPRY